MMKNSRVNRGRHQKRIWIVFLSAIIIIGTAGFLGARYYHNDQNDYEGTFHESSRVDTISYGGKTYRYNEYLSNYLFLGVDTRETVGDETKITVGQADALFLVSHNRKEQTVTCILIPRDTMTYIEALNPQGESLGRSEDHISIQFAMGDGKHKSCRLMKDTVSRLLYDVPIVGYCAISMDGIAPLTEALGGVPLTVPDNSLAEINPEFQQGAVVVLTSENAEQFVRYRDTQLSQSAITRMNRQKAFLQAYVNRAKELSAEDGELILDVYNSLQDYMITNMGDDIFVDLLAAASDDTEMITIPGEGIEGSMYDEYHVDDDQLYEMVIEMFYKEVQD